LPPQVTQPVRPIFSYSPPKGDARPRQTSDEAYGLVALKVRGGVLTVPAPPTPVAERRRIRVIASDVSLTREPPRSKFDPQRPAQANVPGR
jgi:hypothetical protein